MGIRSARYINTKGESAGKISQGEVVHNHATTTPRHAMINSGRRFSNFRTPDCFQETPRANSRAYPRIVLLTTMYVTAATIIVVIADNVKELGVPGTKVV